VSNTREKNLKISFSSCLFALLLSVPVLAQEATEPKKKRVAPASKTTDFIRMTKSEDGKPLSLDTAVISYSAGKKGAQVDLIGAVHIGDASYYTQLNTLFDKYDVLLYELVAPEGTVVSARSQKESNNPVSMLQKSLKSFLGMESQLEKIDYNKKHFVRADMTPDQIAQKMQERGDTALTLALSTMVDVMRQHNKASSSTEANPLMESEMGLMEMLENPQQAKLLMAKQFVSTGSLDQALGGSLNQLLVIDRNAEAMKGLQKQLAEGHQKIGIFYGAAHLPDMDKRLVEEFGMKRRDTQWLKAWDLTSTKGKPIEPVSLMFNLLRQLDK
jgi:hypothetical protein